jgi:hypothetical protein
VMMMRDESTSYDSVTIIITVVIIATICPWNSQYFQSSGIGRKIMRKFLLLINGLMRVHKNPNLAKRWAPVRLIILPIDYGEISVGFPSRFQVAYKALFGIKTLPQVIWHQKHDCAAYMALRWRFLSGRLKSQQLTFFLGSHGWQDK